MISAHPTLLESADLGSLYILAQHPMARYVTVLEGTWFTGTGDTFKFGQAVPLKPGNVMVHPAKGIHWDGSGNAETVVVQVIGEGPATTTAVDSGKPLWIDVPH
jgi:hypothetical protein